MKLPKLSIITVNLNNASGLDRTIGSIVSQTFIDYESIVIDGGSTDGSVKIIKEFNDTISYWVSEPDKGIYNAMNKGILQAQGEYCMFLNSGDYLADNNVLSTIFEDKSYQEEVLYGDISSYPIIKYIKPAERLTLMTFLYSTIPHQSCFIKTKLLHQRGLYNENLKIASDLEFWLKTIVLTGVSYKYLNILVSIRDMNGISDMNYEQGQIPEEDLYLFKKYIPHAILEDYLTFFFSRTSKYFLMFNWLAEKKYLLFPIKFFYKISKYLKIRRNG
jgi:glycosyltransferase involved in cell wall biosynthesis